MAISSWGLLRAIGLDRAEEASKLPMSGSIFEDSIQNPRSKNETSHEPSSPSAIKGVRVPPSGNSENRGYSELGAPTGDVPNIVILATLRCLETKIDNLHNVMEDMPVKVKHFIEKIYLTRALDNLKGVTCMELASPDPYRESNPHAYLADPPPVSQKHPRLCLKAVSSDAPGQRKPCVETDQESQYKQPEVSPVQSQENQCAQALFTNEKGPQKNQCVQPVFTDGYGPEQSFMPERFCPVQRQEDNQVIKQVCHDGEDPDQSCKVEPFYPGGEVPDPDYCLQTVVSEEQGPQQIYKVEPVVPDRQEPDQKCSLEAMFPDVQDPHRKYRLQTWCPAGRSPSQDFRLDPLFPGGKDLDWNYKLDRMYPGGYGPREPPPPWGSEAVLADGAAFIDSLVRRNANPDDQLLKSTTDHAAIMKSKKMLRNTAVWGVQTKKLSPIENQPGQSTEMDNQSTHSEESQRPGASIEHVESIIEPPSFLRPQTNHIKGRPYKCTYCKKSFTQHSQLMVHRRIHKFGKTFAHNESGKCSPFLNKIFNMGQKLLKGADCEKDFAQSSNLHQRQIFHAGENRFECTECGKHFRHASILRRHQICHMVMRPYQCTECDKSFTRRSSLCNHQMIHTGEKPHECPECGKHFSVASIMRRHQISHMVKRPYQCTECDKSFTRRTSLGNHQMIHTGEKPYKCLECGKPFSQKSYLIVHQRSHTGERPYQCPQCAKSFARQSTLYTHQRFHTGVKPYQCTECEKSFHRSSGLKSHQMVHTGEKPFICSECGKYFRQVSVLRQHERAHFRRKSYH